MSFEDVIGQVMQWSTATEALAALGAELQLSEPGADGPVEVVAALRDVSAAAGLAGLDELAPPQRAMVVGLIRSRVREALELLDNPGREPGWTFTDPIVLDGWGRASMMVPAVIAGAHPDLAAVGSFLDVGTGVGLLAVAAAGIWPDSTIVGIDPWAASVERARAHVDGAGLSGRVTLREQTLGDVDDEGTYDCVWIPSFFLSAESLEAGLPAAVRALRPGGWIALGRMRPAPVPLAQAVGALRTMRNGGVELTSEAAGKLLEQSGCDDVHVAPAPGQVPIELVLGRRPG